MEAVLVAGGLRYESLSDMPPEIRALQRWCNNKRIFKKCPTFQDYVT